VDRTAIIEALRERLRAEAAIASAWLFGSVARGTHGAASDIDVAILDEGVTKDSTDRLLDLAAELEAELGRQVQIIRLQNAPPDLIHRVLRDGVLLLDRDRVQRIRFEVRARNLYFDMRPIWLEYRRLRASAP
jgi:uncharacterized protein